MKSKEKDEILKTENICKNPLIGYDFTKDFTVLFDHTMFKFFHSDENREELNEIDVHHTSDEGDNEEDIGQVALDVLDLEDSIVLVAPLAGMSVENIDITVARNILTISGERNRPDIYDEPGRLLVEECFFGPFSRSVVLPENLAFNKIRAQMEDNLLVVEVPKLQFPSKSIKINKLES